MARIFKLDRDRLDGAVAERKDGERTDVFTDFMIVADKTKVNKRVNKEIIKEQRIK